VGLGFKESGHTWAGDAWGYGGLFETREALQSRYDLLMKRLYRDRDTHGIGAGVYTQLTDVEVELNGYMTYDRAIMKFDTARTAAVNRGLAPHVVPELPEFTDAVRVSIHQGTPTEVRYTTDGSEPTASSPLYRGPVHAQPEHGGARAQLRQRRPTAAPESRVEYTRTTGRAPATVAGGVAGGLNYAFYKDTTPEPAFRMHWPVRWQLERPEVRPTDIAPARPAWRPRRAHRRRHRRDVLGALHGLRARAAHRRLHLHRALRRRGGALGGRPVRVRLVRPGAEDHRDVGRGAAPGRAHPITVGYFQAYGPMELQMLVQGPGMRRQRIPNSMLFRDRTPAGGRAATR
jgi:hypothetical protein